MLFPPHLSWISFPLQMSGWDLWWKRTSRCWYIGAFFQTGKERWGKSKPWVLTVCWGKSLDPNVQSLKRINHSFKTEISTSVCGTGRWVRLEKEFFCRATGNWLEIETDLKAGMSLSLNFKGRTSNHLAELWQTDFTPRVVFSQVQGAVKAPLWETCPVLLEHVKIQCMCC